MSLSFLIVALMISATPFVAWQGPAHTIALDAFNAIVLPLYWGRIFMRRERVSFPLALWFWLILLGSFGGLWAASSRTRALLTLSEDIYLYLWFVTLVHLIARHCRIVPVIVTCAVVACSIATLSYVDRTTGAFGGHFSGALRASGTFLNPNMFGSYLVGSFFLAWAVAVPRRPLLYLALPLLFLGILATASNGALLGFLAGVGAAVLARPSKPLWLVGAGLVMAAVGVLAIGMLQNDRLRENLLGYFHGGRSQVGGSAAGSAEERLPIWLDAAESIRKHPMGVGPDNFNKLGGPVSGTYYSPHNDYVGMMAERGPLGLLGWLGILGGTAVLLPRLRGRSDLRVEALYGLVACIALHSTVIEAFHFRHVWLSIALAVAAAWQMKFADPATSSLPELEVA